MTLPPPRPAGTALVTGASSGIGEALAEALADHGYALTLVARRREELARVAERLRDRVDVVPITADLTDARQREELLAQIGERQLEVDILVNNAGSGQMAPVANGDVETDLNTVRLNVEALTDLTGRLVPGMVARGAGAVLHVASTGAFQPLSGQAVYAASKAYALSHGEALHHELVGTGVAVSVVCAGPVRTGFATAAGITDEDLYVGVPSVAFMTPAEVARIALGGLADNTRVVVPGRFNQLFSLVQVHLPRRLLLHATARPMPQTSPPAGPS